MMHLRIMLNRYWTPWKLMLWKEMFISMKVAQTYTGSESNLTKYLTYFFCCNSMILLSWAFFLHAFQTHAVSIYTADARQAT